MTNEETGLVIDRLMTAFPSFEAWVAKHHQQIGEVWRNVLRHTNMIDAEKIVDQLVNGDIEMPANYEYDRMAILIKKESGALTSLRNERTSQYEKYLSKGSMESVGKEATGHIAIAIGTLVKEHKITREENENRMRELLEWDKGGEWKPWMEEMITTKRKKNVLSIK